MWPCRRHLLLPYEFALIEPQATAAMIAALLDDHDQDKEEKSVGGRGSGGGSGGSGGSTLAAAIGRAFSQSLTSHSAAAARLKANPDAAAKLMAKEMANGRAQNGQKLFHNKKKQKPSGGEGGTQAAISYGEQPLRPRRRERKSGSSGGGSGSSSSTHVRRQLLKNVGNDNVTAVGVRESEAASLRQPQQHAGSHRRLLLGAAPAPSSRSSQSSGGGVVNNRKEDNTDLKAHRYYPLFEMKWCRARRDTVASTPTSCFEAMRFFLDSFFLPRLPIFQALAGAAPY
jgi:hypothetical protein